MMIMRALRLLPKTAALAAALVALGVTLAPRASADFTFQWTGSPSAPLAWVPPAVGSSWDLMESNVNNEGTAVVDGAFQAGHGADCSAPPAMHTVAQLVDTVYVCSGHLMTAENDTSAYLTPNQLADWSAGPATVSFEVSTLRTSSRDWWELWLTPFAENLVAPEEPVASTPFFNGPPRDALHILMGVRTGCSLGQPSFGLNNGSPLGTYFHYEVYRGGAQVASGGNPWAGCMEDVAGGVSAAVRSAFRLSVSSSHLTFGMTGPRATATWIDDDLALPFSQAILQLAHRSYNPSKACGFDGTCGPNTFHWSDFTMTGTVPFTMLRPNGNSPVSASTPRTVTLPQAAPAGAFLRLSAFGAPTVAFDASAAQVPHRQDAGQRAESPSGYFTPIPAGTRSVSFGGSSRGGMAWWVEDVAIWAPGAAPAPSPSPSSTPPSSTPTPTSSPTPAPSPISIDGAPCTVALPAGPASGTCTGTFQPT